MHPFAAGLLTGSWDLETVCCELPVNATQSGGGLGGGVVSRHKLPLSAWAIMALHCPAASLQYGYDLSLSLTPSPGPLQSPPYSKLQYQAVRANLCFLLVCLNRLDVTSACGMCPVFSCQSEARVSGRSVAGAVWIRG